MDSGGDEVGPSTLKALVSIESTDIVSGDTSREDDSHLEGSALKSFTVIESKEHVETGVTVTDNNGHLQAQTLQASYTVTENRDDIGAQETDKGDADNIVPPTLGLIGLSTTNYEEVVSEIAHANSMTTVSQTTSAANHALPALAVTKYEEVASDIAMEEPDDSHKEKASEISRSSCKDGKPTIDSAEIAKLVEVATEVEREGTGLPGPAILNGSDVLESSALENQKKGIARYVSSFEDARMVIEAHEILTGTKYVIWRGLAGFGNSCPKSKGRRILWQEMRKSTDQMRHGIERDGVPFMVCGEIIYDCVHGNDNHKSWRTLYAKRVKEMEEKGTPIKSRKRISSSKKVGCPARIYLKEVIRFPDYSPPIFTEFRKKETAKRLRADLDSSKNVDFERRIYISLPTIDEHKFHLIGGNMAEVSQITFKAPVNIAVVKYWGKRNTALNLPLNSSLSVTLGLEEMYAKTTVAVSKNFNEDKFWLNGKKQNIKKDDRIRKCLKELRRMTRKRKDSKDKECMSKQHIHICSENNFPTAAGLASSAAGFACLTAALSKLLGITNEVSHIARQGSGSACRSMYGGFVKWNRGELEDGLDSIAVQIAPETHWPELRVLVLVVNDQKKKVSSTDGMQRSAATSELLWYRAAYVVPMRMEEMEKAIIEKDFEKFSELTMKESSQLHAVCLDTYPSIEPPYLNETSHQIMELVTVLNESAGKMKAAFTFDAGPNAFVFTTDEFFGEVLSLFDFYFKPEGVDGESFFRGVNNDTSRETEIDPNIFSELTRRNFRVVKGTIKYIICTKCGTGPEELPFSESLLNPFGLPIENQNLCDNTLESPMFAKL